MYFHMEEMKSAARLHNRIASFLDRVFHQCSTWVEIQLHGKYYSPSSEAIAVLVVAFFILSNIHLLVV